MSRDDKKNNEVEVEVKAVNSIEQSTTSSEEKAQQQSVERKRKKRASKVPKKIEQHWTAIRTYSETHTRFRGMRRAIVECLPYEPAKALTAAEVRVSIRQFGFDSPESTVHGQLHGLFKIDVVTDADTPDRPCRVSGNPKKTWRLLTDEERDELRAQRELDAAQVIVGIFNDDDEAA